MTAFILIANKELIKHIVMENETNEAVVADTTNSEGEGNEQSNDTIAVSKSDYEKLNQTLGSLKRELKDLKKSKEESVKETSKTNQPDEISSLKNQLENMSLRQAGLTHQDDIELAKNTAKKWGVSIDEVLADEDFKVKLERQQTTRANVEATSGVKGGSGGTQAKNTPEYWMAKGVPPTPNDVPDGKTRRAIVRKMLNASQSSEGSKFYNE